MDEKPCCAAEALRRIRQVNVGGIMVGISMLDYILEEVKALDFQSRNEVEDELLKRVKIYNYVPKPAEEQYRVALMKEFEKVEQRGG